MKSIPIETLLIFDPLSTGDIFTPQRCYVRVEDEAAGPFLAIRGEDDEPFTSREEHKTSFYLCTDDDINDFAAECRRLLKAAESK